MKAPDTGHFDPQRPTADLLLWSYRRGIFPMADLSVDRIDWYSPDPRGVIPLGSFRVRKSLQRIVKRGDFEIRSDCAFEQVIRACGDPRGSDWINDRLIRAYCELNEIGCAHSVEAWRNDQLVGGLYGVQIGGAYFGESMFSRPRAGGTNASKVCLVHLVRWLRHRKFTLLDTQYWSRHLNQFGCIEISREEYLSVLQKAVNQPVTWGHFHPLGCEDV